MTSGDKYIIYSENLHQDHDYLSDYGNISHQQGSFPKLVKIRVVSIEDSGKIIYLDSTTKWYDNNYYINRTEQDGVGPDIDSYRSLISSAYSIFSSKVSGKLALLVELEKITGFNCSWEPYIAEEPKQESEDSSLYNIKYNIHWNFEWITDDNNINPNGAVLLESKWVDGSGKPYIWYPNKENNELYLSIYNKEYPIPIANPEKGPDFIFSRKYKPEDTTINYNKYLTEYKFDTYLSKTLNDLENKLGNIPTKLNISKNTNNIPDEGKYFVNCVKTESINSLKKHDETYIRKNTDNFYIDTSGIYTISNSNKIYKGETEVKFIEGYHINDIYKGYLLIESKSDKR
jgi:hypothetical protein